MLYCLMFVKRLKESVELCENTECENCPIAIENLEQRTEFEKKVLHYPCCLNLIERESWVVAFTDR